MIKISTSILSSSDRLISIKKLNNSNTDYIHIDTMDGNFVPNKQMNIDEIIELEKISTKPLDIHLMVENPEIYINSLQKKNIEYITIHIEIDKNINNLIKKIKTYGYKVGLSIKPNTNISTIIPYLDKIDLVLIMSVEPGFGGQEFIPSTLEKVKQLRKINESITIEMDGGIKDTNINQLKEYIDIAVVGSYITKKEDYNEAINSLKN